MKLWRISQSENDNYDTYDSAVVAANTEAAARGTHPDGWGEYSDASERWVVPQGAPWRSSRHPDNTWVSPEHVSVKLIGDALPSTKAGVICASFNAG